MSYRTPLRRVEGLGSAREGTAEFWRQRLTAIANIPLMLFLGLVVVKLGGADRADMAGFLANPLAAGAMVLAMASMALHMHIGVKIVIEDYVHSEGRKFALIVLNTFYPLAVLALSVISILILAFGS